MRLTPAERTQLERAAALDGTTLTEYVRSSALTHAAIDLEHGAGAADGVIASGVDEELVLAAREWLDGDGRTRPGSRLYLALRALLRGRDAEPQREYDPDALGGF